MSNFKLTLQQNKPQILAGASIVGFITGAVLTGIATWKSKDKILECKDVIGEINSDLETGKIDSNTAKNCKRKIVMSTAGHVAKNFLPAVGTISAATVAAVKSNQIHTNRTVGAMAAAQSFSTMLEKYRERVRNDLGVEADNKYYYGYTDETVEKTIVDAKGKEKKVKESVRVIDDKDMLDSEFCKYFDETSKLWEKSPEYNLQLLKSKENELNRLLKNRGYLFVNEVWDAVDLPITASGQFMGWLYEKDNPLGGPNHFSFNVVNMYNRRSLNGYEPIILLNLKPDGNIFDIKFKSMKELPDNVKVKVR